jgi:rare lipoprotein A
MALAVAIAASAAGVAQAENAEDPLTQVGVASWYGPGFHGRLTASGERFDQQAMTAAHRKLPLGTRVKVTNLENDRFVIVEINDRGPYIRGRVLDLSKGAARSLGMVEDGLAEVRIEVLPPERRRTTVARGDSGTAASLPSF